MKREADHGQRGDGDLEQLDAPRHNGLVVAVGEFAAEAGQKEERAMSAAPASCDQGAGFGPGELEQRAERPAPS